MSRITSTQVRQAIHIRWTPREIDFFLSEFERIYDWRHDFGIRKQAGEFPRLCQFFMGGRYFRDHIPLGGMDAHIERMAQILSKHAMLAVNIFWMPGRVRDRQEAALKRARELHPDLKILAYIPTDIPPVEEDGDALINRVHEAVPEAGKIKVQGEWVGLGWKVLDFHRREICDWYLDMITDYVFDRVPGLYDGVQFDQIKARHHMTESVFQKDIQQHVDWDGDGSPDIQKGLRWMQDHYIKSKIQFLRTARKRFGDDRIITGIFAPWTMEEPEVQYYQYANGQVEECLFEHIRSPEWLLEAAKWSTTLSYPRPGRYHLLGMRTRNRDCLVSVPDRREVRFGLALACMGDSHWFADTGGDVFGHEELWWFPEYNCNLGHAKGQARCFPEQHYMLREFDRGMVVLNSIFRMPDGIHEFFPSFRADLLESPATTAHITLPRPMYSMSRETIVDTLSLGIYDADLLLDPRVHPAPKPCGPAPCYRVRRAIVNPWIAHIRSRTP